MKYDQHNFRKRSDDKFLTTKFDDLYIEYVPLNGSPSSSGAFWAEISKIRRGSVDLELSEINIFKVIVKLAEFLKKINYY